MLVLHKDKLIDCWLGVLYTPKYCSRVSYSFDSVDVLSWLWIAYVWIIPATIESLKPSLLLNFVRKRPPLQPKLNLGSVLGIELGRTQLGALDIPYTEH